MPSADLQLDVKALRLALRQACAPLSSQLLAAGFRRSGACTWVRSNGDILHHLWATRRGASYGAAISNSVWVRLETSARLAGEAPILHVLGPTTGPVLERERGYHLRFNARSGDMLERCQRDLVRFYSDLAHGWFESVSTPDALRALTGTSQLLPGSGESAAKP